MFRKHAMTNQRLEAIVGLVIMIVSALVYFLVIPNYVELDDFSSVSPDLLPKVAVVFMGVLGGLMFVHRQFMADDDNTPSPISKQNVLQVLIIAVIFVGGIVALRLGGYLVGGALLVAALMIYMGARSWLQILLTSVLSTAILFGFFEVILGVPLP